ncbi:MAG TPA: hypothetical protein VFB72_18260 [Verrucomicrobiae bacterium]|nr:hypothetical protein [Verrucomicrobiae bacterium]
MKIKTTVVAGILLLSGLTDLLAGSAWVIQAGQSTIFSGGKCYLVLVQDDYANAPYQLIGITDNTHSTGTDTFQPVTTPEDSGPLYMGLSFNDKIFGRQWLYFQAQGSPGGQFSTTAPQGSSSLPGPFGNLSVASWPAPNSLSNHSYYLNITDGRPPFPNQGSVIFTPSSTGSYSIFPVSGGTSASEGIYSYSVTNTALGCLSVNDAALGESSQYFAFETSTNGIYMLAQPSSGGYQVGNFTVSNLVPAMFFMGQADLSTNVEWLQFSNGTPFGYYDVMDFGFPCFYHVDMGFEWFFDANNSAHGCYLYDFASKSFFYTDPQVFPFLYDFNLNAWLYYYPDPNHRGHYSSNPRYFYNFGTQETITK